MGDVSVIARRLKDGHVQHGWSGNGGYYGMVGARLLTWYTEPEKVEYLFGLGQIRLIGAPGSEHGGYSFFETHSLDNMPHYLGCGENDIFSKIAFIDYAYLYDVDDKWYYIAPRAFNIKMPLELVDNNLDKDGYEFNFLECLETDIFDYIFNDYVTQDTDFLSYIESKGLSIHEIFESCKKKNYPLHEFVRGYEKVADYFDNWVVVEANEDNTKVIGLKIKKDEGEHKETCEW